jgi:hypothetical protein
MLNIAIGKKSIIVIGVFVIALSFMSSVISAQTYLHKVVKGDTLWSICEQYYGDALLWPKLWQMNPFITNPHLLGPGDLINLLEDRPITTGAKPIIKPTEPVSGTTTEVSTPAPQTVSHPTVKPTTSANGIDISSFADVKTMGYLTFTNIQPWGRIHTKSTDKILFEEGELTFVQLFIAEGIKVGQEFLVYRADPYRNLFTKKLQGQTLEVLGKLVLKKPLEKGFYLMQVTKLFRTIDINDLIIPIEPISPCILPISSDIDMIANIMALKDQQQIIGARSVVYLDQGFNQGVQRGQIYHIIKNIVATEKEIKYLSFRKVPVTDPFTNGEKSADLMDLSLGKLIIVQSRPDTAVGIVFQMESQESTTGVVVKSIAWDDPPDWLKRLPTCQIR